MIARGDQGHCFDRGALRLLTSIFGFYLFKVFVNLRIVQVNLLFTDFKSYHVLVGDRAFQKLSGDSSRCCLFAEVLETVLNGSLHRLLSKSG